MLSVGIPSFVFAVSKVELVSGGKFQSRVVAVLLVEGAAAEDAHGLVLAVQQVACLQREVEPVVEERLLNQAAYLYEGVVDAVGGIVAAGLAMEIDAYPPTVGEEEEIVADDVEQWAA